MTITFPMEFPPDLIDGGRMRPVVSVGATRSPFSFHEQLQAWGGETWEVEIDVGPLVGADGQRFSAFVSALRGRVGSFRLPASRLGLRLLGSAAGNPVADGANQQGAVLATRGWTANAPGVLLAGDFFSLGSGGSTRLHQVLGDVDADATGRAEVDIFPRLREAPSDGQALITADPRILLRLTEQPTSWEVDPHVAYSFTLTAREAL